MSKSQASVEDIQKALLALNISVGPSGADGKMGKNTAQGLRDFQHSRGLFVSGQPDEATLEALFPPAVPAIQVAAISKPIPDSWMPKARMLRIICHWTAGRHSASKTDREHYHILFEGDGTAVRGIPTIDKNDASGAKRGYAAHTLNCNTGSVGVSLCCMAGAVESPFSAGPAPMTEAQWKAMVAGVAQLCRQYGIPVTPKTVLSHAEVQGNLGIRQRGKWDYTRLAFAPKIVGATACGNLLRQSVAALL